LKHPHVAKLGKIRATLKTALLATSSYTKYSDDRAFLESGIFHLRSNLNDLTAALVA
jgi:hypothetical protein